jgi:hypothetical protein
MCGAAPSGDPPLGVCSSCFGPVSLNLSQRLLHGPNVVAVHSWGRILPSTRLTRKRDCISESGGESGGAQGLAEVHNAERIRRRV